MKTNHCVSIPAGAVRQQGFTLIEVLLAAAVGVILLMATLSLFDSTNSAKVRLTRTNEVFQTGVFALNTLQTDLRLAGFYGEGVVSASVPSSQPDPCSTTASDWRSALGLPVQAWLAGASGVPSCIPTSSLVSDSSVIVIRRAATCEIGTAGCSDGTGNTPMVQVSQCKDDATTNQTGTAAGDFSLKNVTCAAAAPRRQFYTRIYYLTRNNVDGDGIGTLKRLDLMPGPTRTTVTVAQGVQQMRLVYGIDTNNDSVADEWSSAPAYSKLKDVVTVQVNLLMKSSDADRDYSNNRSYQMGDLLITSANDNYFRTLVSATVRLNNVAGARETITASSASASSVSGG